MSGDTDRLAPIFISGREGKAHVARYKPTGYGVAALCGKSWREGQFTILGFRPVEICLTCRRKAALSALDGDT